MMDEVYQLLDYLPIDDAEVNNYVTPLLNSAQVTHEKEQYQFSYFAVHLIFMTYIYLTVWKISQFHKEKYEHSLLFARPYNGSDINLKQVSSIFDYSYLPEKDIFELFSLIGLDNGYIKSTKKLIDYRNDMAHATGKIQILNMKQFEDAIADLLSVCINIQKNMEETIKEWYKNKLLCFARTGNLDGKILPIDFIDEILIGNLSFSKKDLFACSEYGISRFKDQKKYKFEKNEHERLINLHDAIKVKYKEIDNIE
jgi:hypothetical protein